MAAVRTGAIEASLPALKFAARQGVLGAQLELAELYSGHCGIPENAAKSYAYYREIAAAYADIPPSSPIAKYVAKSFVAMGRYQLKGDAKIGVAPNPVRAADLFRHAASYFGDPEAQYELAKLYLTGRGVERDVRLGINWLALAARKQHPESEATLGEMLWRDRRAKPRYARGLALIALAHYNASLEGNEPKWIKKLYVKALRSSNKKTRLEAEALIPRWGGPKILLLPGTPKLFDAKVVASKPAGRKIETKSIDVKATARAESVARAKNAKQLGAKQIDTKRLLVDKTKPGADGMDAAAQQTVAATQAMDDAAARTVAATSTQTVTASDEGGTQPQVAPALSNHSAVPVGFGPAPSSLHP